MSTSLCEALCGQAEPRTGRGPGATPAHRGQRRRRAVHHRQRLPVVRPSRQRGHPRQPQLRGADDAVDDPLLRLRAVAAGTLAQAVAAGEHRAPVRPCGEPHLGPVRRPARWSALAVRRRRLLHRLLSTGDGGPAAVPQGGGDTRGGVRLRARRRRRAFRNGDDRGALPHHPHAANGQRWPALAPGRRRLPSRRRAAVLRAHVARRPAPVAATRRKHRGPGGRAGAPVDGRPPSQPQLTDGRQQRGAPEHDGGTLLDPGRVGRLRAAAPQVRGRQHPGDPGPRPVRVPRRVRRVPGRLRGAAPGRGRHPAHAARRDDRRRGRRDSPAAGASGARPARERDAARAQGFARDREALPIPGDQLIRHHLHGRRGDHDPLRHTIGAERARL